MNRKITIKNVDLSGSLDSLWKLNSALFHHIIQVIYFYYILPCSTKLSPKGEKKTPVENENWGKCPEGDCKVVSRIFPGPSEGV